ncbi:P-loop containing nucleoside triphosphate hydrolase protein, partial [Jimgerdemannia flammicorona]
KKKKTVFENFSLKHLANPQVTLILFNKYTPESNVTPLSCPLASFLFYCRLASPFFSCLNSIYLKLFAHHPTAILVCLNKLIQIPTVFENYVTDVKIDGKPVQLALWDTAGQEEYERLRPLSYSKANVILVGFAIDTPDSLDNVLTKWIEEVNTDCPGVPVILVGLKKDLREDPNIVAEMQRKGQSFVSQQQAETIAAQIGARRYLECSSLTGDGVDDVFEHATRAALLQRMPPSDIKDGGCCVIL